MKILAYFIGADATQHELIYRQNPQTNLNELLLIKSELDLANNPYIVEVKSIPNFWEYEPEKLNPKTLDHFYILICNQQIPTPSQITLFSKLKPEQKYLLKMACNNLTCNNCPLFPTIGCFQLLTTSIHSLLTTKIIKFLQSTLTPIDKEHVDQVWDLTIGRKLSSGSLI